MKHLFALATLVCSVRSHQQRACSVFLDADYTFYKKWSGNCLEPVPPAGLVSQLFFNFIFFSYPYCTFLVGVPRPLIVCVFVCAVDTMPPEGVRCGMEEK